VLSVSATRLGPELRAALVVQRAGPEVGAALGHAVARTIAAAVREAAVRQAAAVQRVAILVEQLHAHGAKVVLVPANEDGAALVALASTRVARCSVALRCRGA